MGTTRSASAVPSVARYVDESGQIIHTGAPSILFRGAAVAFPDDDEVYEVRSLTDADDAVIVTVRIIEGGF